MPSRQRMQHQPLARERPSKVRAAHSVRIIGGQWRRSLLPVIDNEGLRPTPDRVRETVFNWIDHLQGRQWQHAVVLDLFAGSGALGFEAGSRGARQVTLIDTSPDAVRSLKAVATRLDATAVTVLRADALSYLAQAAPAGERFDLIFLDPPFAHGWLDRVLVPARDVLRTTGLLYVEAETPLDGEGMERLGLDIVRADKAGQVFYHLLRRNIDAAGFAPKTVEDEPC